LRGELAVVAIKNKNSIIVGERYFWLKIEGGKGETLYPPIFLELFFNEWSEKSGR